VQVVAHELALAQTVPLGQGAAPGLMQVPFVQVWAGVKFEPEQLASAHTVPFNASV